MTTDTTELIDRAEVRDGQAIVSYSRTEAALAELRAKYKDARYDLTTTAGDKAARGARLALVTLRSDLEKKRKELKAPALEFGKKIDAEAARLTGEILALETPIDAQIKADEKRREDERRAREEAEAARKKVHTDAIAKIAGYVSLAADMPSERIARGVAMLEAMDLTGFEEFADEATATRDNTVTALRGLHAKAQAREQEAARLKAEREEQARVAAEQAEAARKLQEQQAELDRKRAELEAEERRQQAERDRIRAEEEARAAEKLRQEQAAREAEERRQRAAAEEQQRREWAEKEALTRSEPLQRTLPPAGAPLAAPAVSSQAANVVPMPTKAPAGPPTLQLGEIKARLAPLSIDAAGLAALGFPHAAQQGAAKLWHDHQWSAICAALVAHITSRQNQQRAA